MITASVVTYHTPLEEVERAIRLASESTIERLWIVDNACQTDIEDLSLQYPDFVSYVASANVGYGAAHNKAIREAAKLGARYHIVLNTDIVYAPGDISLIADYAGNDDRIVAVQPRICGDDGELQYTVRRLPTPLDVFGRRFLPACLMKGRNDRYLLKYMDHNREFDVPYHQGSFMFLRMDALVRCGGFDERFFLYPEDIDLTRRLHAIGKTLYWPGVTITHSHRAASYHNWRLMAVHCRNMVRYFNKWGWFFDRQRRQFNRQIRK